MYCGGWSDLNESLAKYRIEEQKRKYRANKGLYEGNMIFNCRNKKRVLSDIQGETKKAAITVNDGC